MAFYYLYALVSPGKNLPIFSEFNLDTIEYQGFDVIYQPVSENEFNEQALAENLQQPEWVAKQAHQHQAVIAALFEGREAVIPFRMATIFETLDNLKKSLIEQERIYRRTIEFLNDKSEWGVKCYFPKESFSTLFSKETDAEIQALQEEYEAASEGKRFFIQKKLEELQKEKAGLYLQRFLDTLQVKLTLCSVGVMELKNQSAKATGRTEKMLRNLTFLVDGEDLERFQTAYEKAQAEAAERGILFEKTGPWPPYNFVS